MPHLKPFPLDKKYIDVGLCAHVHTRRGVKPRGLTLPHLPHSSERGMIPPIIINPPYLGIPPIHGNPHPPAIPAFFPDKIKYLSFW